MYYERFLIENFRGLTDLVNLIGTSSINVTRCNLQGAQCDRSILEVQITLYGAVFEHTENVAATWTN